MNKIDKFIARLNKKDQETLLNLLEKIKERDLESLDIKKLQGIQNVYRVRKGKLRIIFQLGDICRIIKIDTRDDDTYRF